MPFFTRDKNKQFFFEQIEGGERLKENPPLTLDEVREMHDSGELLSLGELSKYLGWARAHIALAVRKQGLTYVRIGEHRFFSKQKVREWFKEKDRERET